MSNTFQFIENNANYVDLELPVIACTFEIEKIEIKQISYSEALLLNFFKTTPFYKCNFDELLSLNKVGAEDKENLKEIMQNLLSCKKLFNNSSYYNDLQEICIGLSPLGEKLFEQGYVLTNTILSETYTCYYDIAARTFLTESESKTVLPKEQSFFQNKNYRFLRSYIQDDSFLLESNLCMELPIPFHSSDQYSASNEENAITERIKNGFYYSKQKITRKKITSRLIKNCLSISNTPQKFSYHLDKKFEDIFKNYSEDYINTVLEKQKKNNANAFDFNTNVFQYLSWTTEELKDLLEHNNYIVFVPEGIKAAVPCNDENKIVRISKQLFVQNSEFKFFVYAHGYMYTINQSFYNSTEFKDYQGNRISKEQFFQPFKFHLENSEIDTSFMEILPIIEKTNSLSLFIDTLSQIKKISMQKLVFANRFFKNNPEWKSFFKTYMQNIILKDILANGYNNLKNLLALQRIADIPAEDILDIIQETEYTVARSFGSSLSLLERKCLWYDELCLHNFSKKDIRKNIIALAPQIKERKEISEDTYTILSDEFKQLIAENNVEIDKLY